MDGMKPWMWFALGGGALAVWYLSTKKDSSGQQGYGYTVQLPGGQTVQGTGTVPQGQQQQSSGSNVYGQSAFDTTRKALNTVKEGEQLGKDIWGVVSTNPFSSGSE